MAKVLITNGVPADRLAYLKPHHVVQPAPGKAFTREELLALLPTCDAAVICCAFDKTLVAACTQAKLLVCYGAGYDSIDIDAATEYGIPVANIPDSVTDATAELAMAHILSLTRRVSELDREMRANESTANLFTMGQTMGVSLKGMVLGIIGMGRIGARVAEFGRFIGMHVVYSGHTLKPFSAAGNARRLPLADLLKQADVVSLHCPLTPETKGMLSTAELALLKPTAFLINVSRGKLIDEAALAGALEQGRLAGAALDVFEAEPEVNQRLKTLPNVVLTPHVGSNTLLTRNEMAEQCVVRIMDALAGKKPGNLLNPATWPRM